MLYRPIRVKHFVSPANHLQHAFGVNKPRSLVDASCEPRGCCGSVCKPRGCWRDISSNTLSGSIPLSLDNLTKLMSFNVSMNFLTGRIPSKAVLLKFNETCFVGNRGLCGKQIDINCKDEIPSPSGNSQLFYSVQVEVIIKSQANTQEIVAFLVITLVIMEKSDHVCVKFTGKNYAAWEFQLEIFLKGKELWGHINGNTKEGATAADRAAWAAKDNHIMTWILVSMEPHLILSLCPHKSAKAMWDYLKQVYNQDNNARRFQLELAIANYTQGDLSVQEYYSGFLTLWNDYLDLVIAKLSTESVEAVQQVARFKLDIVYHRRSSMLTPSTPALSASPLRHSIRITGPPDLYGFPSHDTGDIKRTKNSAKLVTSAVATVGALLLVALMCFWGCFLYKKFGKGDISGPAMDISGGASIVMFHGDLPYSSKDILRKLETLNEGNIIGSGGFGTVYKLAMDDGNVFALKRIMKTNEVLDRFFDRELEILGSIKHRYLVNLRGYCNSPSSKLLIYDFLPGGSLDEVLHENCRSIVAKEETFPGGILKQQREASKNEADPDDKEAIDSDERETSNRLFFRWKWLEMQKERTRDRTDQRRCDEGRRQTHCLDSRRVVGQICVISKIVFDEIDCRRYAKQEEERSGKQPWLEDNHHAVGVINSSFIRWDDNKDELVDLPMLLSSLIEVVMQEAEDFISVGSDSYSSLGSSKNAMKHGQQSNEEKMGGNRPRMCNSLRAEQLDWDARLHIIMGAAKGLAYLHHDCSPRIIHRDIKASNILLDGNLEARVSDFGLAKLLEDEESHITTIVVGTFGYLAPVADVAMMMLLLGHFVERVLLELLFPSSRREEKAGGWVVKLQGFDARALRGDEEVDQQYMQSGRATEKTDVYSFGVLVLEVLSGKRPTDSVFIEKGLNIVGWLNFLIVENRPREIIDPMCEGTQIESLDALLSVAIQCVSSSPEDRPTMHRVVQMLESEVMTPCPSDFYDSNSD
ncbi:hypothetical protein ZIOFF_068220 [Zingiber officinale]|uniref:non-specific serine/threonine protein kinase n=1 Tax=Zingiber officinale TaxID=94328 RepID=A0A8J5CFY9_ZINOF|nr:hypothetical protein ZIOFF_068220 [Zingiber officinale]